MANHQYTNSYYDAPRDAHPLLRESINSYAASTATTGSDHDKRSSSSGSPPSSGSSASIFAYNESAVISGTPPRSQGQAHRQRAYSSTEQVCSTNSNLQHAPASARYAARPSEQGVCRTTGRGSISFGPQMPPMSHEYQGHHAFSLHGVPESVSVQETAFRQGQRDSASFAHKTSTSPFVRQFDQLWAAFYKLGRECGDQRAPTPVAATSQNFAWPVLINPYTQSLKQPNGSMDPAWSRKVIQAALNCMQELIRITCRRNNGWEKTVADIPLPAQEALQAFPDLAEQYEQLKRDAREARAGGRPYGY